MGTEQKENGWGMGRGFMELAGSGRWGREEGGVRVGLSGSVPVPL